MIFKSGPEVGPQVSHEDIWQSVNEDIWCVVGPTCTKARVAGD